MGCGASRYKPLPSEGEKAVQFLEERKQREQANVTQDEDANASPDEIPGAEMQSPAPEEVAVSRDRVMQTLITLVAAAAMERLQPGGVVRVTSSSPQHDGALAFSMTSALAGCEKELKQDVEALIADGVAIRVVTMGSLDAHKYLCEAKYELSAALVASLGVPEVCMYSIDLKGGGVFRTPAVASLAPIASLKGVAWDICPDENNSNSNRKSHFFLVGPSAAEPSSLGVAAAGFHKLRAAEVTLAEANSSALPGDKRLLIQRDQERMHETDIDQLANMIVHKFVVVVGPSSAGKTTFTHRFSEHIKHKLGVESHVIECDDYYRARLDPEHPRDANGELDFERPEALRLEKLRQDLTAMKAGQRVELPKFNFKDGTVNDASGHFVQLDQNSILMMEGIFGLHPAFQAALDMPCFKVLIGPWSGLQVDNLYIVPEKMMRVMRRIGRDTVHRGVSAAQVLHKVSSVARGEQANIFPFAGNADAVFDAALGYEVSALRENMFTELKKTPADTEAAVAASCAELRNLLSWVKAWPQLKVPEASILSEFVAAASI